MTTARFHRWTLVQRCALALLLVGLIAPSRAAATDRERQLLEVSGVATDRVPHYLATIDSLAAECQTRLRGEGDPYARVQSLHAFLHERVLRGTYLASASDVGEALDGGTFNCVAATLLLRMLADRCGLEADVMSTRGHVWCRVIERTNGGRASVVDIESTCRNWFEISAKYRGMSTERVSPGMQAHRQRVASGRALADRQILAVLHFNRGVTLIRENRVAPAAWANLQALSLDADCEPARENLAAVARELGYSNDQSLSLESRLILWAIQAAVKRNSTPASPLAAR